MLRKLGMPRQGCRAENMVKGGRQLVEYTSYRNNQPGFPVATNQSAQQGMM